MAVRPATFTGFDPYKLTGVRVTDRELGHGSYATVLELEYMGLKCAGKKIYNVLLRQGDDSYQVRRFEEECRLLSQVRHPNIVQFLGVYFEQRVRAPILVMEFLPTNLTSCIEQYDILPKEISYSILHDVALGLCYLHNQTPPIIHRDLSSNNVLLTPNMTAKISDLGVARILNLTPLQVSCMTGTPGTPAYMPPEVMVASPKYNTSVDEFSYGILMIHMFSGRWPEPQVGPNRTKPDGTLIPVSEAERHEVFLRTIGSDHPLMDLVLKCIHNHPQARAHASEIVDRLAEMVLQFPASFVNRLKMLRQIEAVEREKRALTEEGERKDRVIEDKESQVSSLRKEVQAEKERKTSDIDRLKLVYFSEVEQLRLQFRELNTQNQLMKAEKEAEIVELKSKAEVLKNQVENNAKSLLQEREQSARQLIEEREQHEIQIKKEREQSEIQLAKEKEQNEILLVKERQLLIKEREANRKLVADAQDLQSNLLKSRSEITTLLDTNSKLQSDVTEKDTTIQMKDTSVKRKDSELEAKSRALEEKDATISAMSEWLAKTREYLTTKQQVSTHCLSMNTLKMNTKVLNPLRLMLYVVKSMLFVQH